MSAFLIADIRIFTGQETIEKGSVLVEHGKISKISTSSISFDGTTISKPNHTLIPGLIDTHVHVDGGNSIALPQSLRFGVTTVCDMGNENYNIDKLRRQIASSNGDCADLKTTSFAATIDMGWPMPVVLAYNDTPATREEIATWPKLTTPESGRQYVRDRVAEGVDYIKLMHESGAFMAAEFAKPSLDLQKAVIEEAHQHGLMTVAHATCLEDTVEILEAGVDGLTHMFVDRVADQRVVDAYKRRGAHCNPTLACMGSSTTEGQALQEKFAHDPRVRHLLGEAERDRMCMCMGFAKGRGKVSNAYESVKVLKKAGVPIVIGSDAAGPAVGTAWGLSVHHELAIFVNECDFTPVEALAAATYLPAQRFSFADRGQIKEGLRADLVLVEGNPMENIDHTLDIKGVWTAGDLCSVYKDKL